MSNDAHIHRVAQDGLIEYSRGDGEPYDTHVQVPYGELVGRQEYVDHAGRETSVNEYDSGRADIFVGEDQHEYWELGSAPKQPEGPNP